ncbi:MAG: M14 family metallopeptidase [Bacteroidales bacterium]
MKILTKILKYGVLPLLILIVAVLSYISLDFGKLSFKDDFPVSEDYSALYPDSYESARDNFRSLSEELYASYKDVQYFPLLVASKTDSDLTIDVCYIPAQGDSLNLLILSSGVHGVEGYVGHAAQQLFLENYLSDEFLENTGVLLIHAVNPYGFKYTRRVTENNLDMNRNSPSTPDLYETKNEGYSQVYDLINPQKKVKVRSLENRFFFVKAINEIRKASLPVLRQAVLQGQYTYPEGLYFGGQSPEPQIDLLKPVISEISFPYEKIMMLDLYTVTGDFAGFVGSLNPEKEFYPMVFEYGTLNSQTTMGSLKSIHIMILENQGHQHGFASTMDSIRVKADILEMYYPESESWRNYSMQQTRDVFDVVFPRFTEQGN